MNEHKLCTKSIQPCAYRAQNYRRLINKKNRAEVIDAGEWKTARDSKARKKAKNGVQKTSEAMKTLFLFSTESNYKTGDY